MDFIRTCFLFIVVLTFVDVYYCGRTGGGSRSGGSRPTHHSPSPSYRSPSPSYHSPSPSYHSPSPSYNRPRPSGPTSAPHRYGSSARPPSYEQPSRVATARPVNSQNSRPSGPTAPPHRYGSSARPPSQEQPSRVATARPVNSQINRPTPRPPSYEQPSRRFTTARSVTPQRISTRTRPHTIRTTPRRSFSTTRSSLSWDNRNSHNPAYNLPPRPGSGPVGPPSHYYGSQSGPHKVKIVNKYNYHYPGYYSMPLAHYSHPGYFYAPSYYHYGVHDTGSTALGFYLGYSLAKLSTPTYSHYSFYDGYRPRYDHYTVHHYYHNSESVPKYQEIRSNTIVGCVGDSSSICPANTTSLCTSNGALMCVASAVSTVPCSNNRDINCVTSTISCENNTAPECKNAQKGTATVSIPCVSKAHVEGEVKNVNNTIIPANATTIGIPVNTTTNTDVVASANSTVSTNDSISTNITTNNTVSTSTSTTAAVTQYPITTTPVPQRLKRDVAENYCVTILALPATREKTAGEEFYNDASFLAEKFIESVWSL